MLKKIFSTPMIGEITHNRSLSKRIVHLSMPGKRCYSNLYPVKFIFVTASPSFATMSSIDAINKGTGTSAGLLDEMRTVVRRGGSGGLSPQRILAELRFAE